MSAIAQIKLACPHCGQHIACDANLADTQLKCPACVKLFSVPALPRAALAPTTPAPGRKRLDPGPFFGTLALLILLIALPIVVRLSMDPMWRMRNFRMSPKAKQQLGRMMRKKADFKHQVMLWGSYCVVGFGAFYLARGNTVIGRFRVAPWIVSGLCVAAAYALEHKPSPPAAKPLSPAGQKVVPPRPGMPLLGSIKPDGNTQFRSILLYNPPGAITVALETKSPVANYFRQMRYFRDGAAVIKFDLDNDPKTGAPDPILEGFDTHAVLDFVAIGEDETGPLFAAATLGPIKEYRVESELSVYDKVRDRFEGVTSGIYDRALVKGNSILVTFTYDELKVSSGQTIRVALLDRSNGLGEEKAFAPVIVTLK